MEVSLYLPTARSVKAIGQPTQKTQTYKLRWPILVHWGRKPLSSLAHHEVTGSLSYVRTHASRVSGYPILIYIGLSLCLLVHTGCHGLGRMATTDTRGNVAKGSSPAAVPPTMLKAIGPTFPAEADEQWYKVSKDLNHDGIADYRIMYDSEAMSRIMRDSRDLNFDGKDDAWRFFSPAGSLVKEELDLDYDGRVDLLNTYDANSGVLVLQEMAMGFHGRLSGRRILRDGKVTSVEYDTDGDGVIDTWEFYEKQKLVRIGKDTNNDGKQDSFVEPDPSLTGQSTLVFPVSVQWTGEEAEGANDSTGESTTSSSGAMGTERDDADAGTAPGQTAPPSAGNGEKDEPGSNAVQK